MSIYKKDITLHSEFYLAKFTKNLNNPYLLFIHGGPGFNCATIEYLIENKNFFSLLDHNIIIYDQRNCGKSKQFSTAVCHQDNVNDLHNIIHHLNSSNTRIHGLIGHSYGAKLLYDYYHKFHSRIPGVFISTANSILTPRLNNLILDLAYLKKSDPIQYRDAYQEINNFDLDKIWNLSEKLTPLFHKNKDRPYLYWANLECFEMIQDAQNQINQPIDMDTFVSVRKDLYSNQSNFSVDIDTLSIPHLWVNGFHDFIMNGSNSMFSSNAIITFYKSAHYPHLEENDHFCELVNEFLKTF